MPPGFVMDGEALDLWLPLHFEADPRDQGHNTMTLARLKAGVSLAQAQADMRLLLPQVREAFPGHVGDRERGVVLEPYHEQLIGDVRPTLLLLGGAVALVLLIATANVAALFLGRAAAREQELAVRRALGASPKVAIRPLVLESVILSLVGGAVGLVFAAWSLPALLSIGPQVPLVDTVRLDLPALAVAFLGSVTVGLLAGLAPAFRRSRHDLRAIHGGDRALGPVRQRARTVLVSAQLALSTALVAGAVLLVVSVSKLWSTDPGFDPAHLWAVQMSLPPEEYRSQAQAVEFSEDLRRRFAALPGVSSVAATSSVPLERGLNFWVSAMKNGERTAHIIEYRSVSADYFRTLGIALERGRAVMESDTRESPRVAVVNQRLAGIYWPDRDPIGETVWIGGEPAQVVGLAKDVREFGLDRPTPSLLYVPQSQVPDGLGAAMRGWFLASWVVRSPVPLELATMQRVVAAVNPAQPVVSVRSMDDIVVASFGWRRVMRGVLDLFASLALGLAAIGVFGVVSYSVRRRRRELGLRAALGARREELVRLVVAQGLQLALTGTVVGVVLALLLTRFLRDFLFGVGPANPLILAATCIGLITVAVFASLVPAYHAARVDPMEALRSE